MKPGRLKSFVEARRTEWVCVLLAAATFVVYWQVSRFEFTNYDEFKMVLSNPYVLGGVTREGLWWALTTSWFEYWHPLTWMSHSLDCELFGLSPGWHHLVSLGFHVANTLLLFAVLRRMTEAFWRSAIVAALFALHPLHVESVAWVAERKDVLSGFFFMLTLWAYVRYSEKSKVQSLKSKLGIQQSGVRSQNPASSLQPPASDATRNTQHATRFYLLSLFFFALGLMSKPMLVTLPFVLLLLDFWPLQRYLLAPLDLKPSARKFHPSSFILHPLLLEKLPFFLLSVASCAITYLSVEAGGSILSTRLVPWGLRLANVPVSYVRYLGKMIWPAGLIPLYPAPNHYAGWQVGGAVLVLVVITLFTVRRARSAPYWIVGWLLFLGVLFPTLGLVRVGLQSIADRYTYIPSIGIFMAVVWAAAEWGSRSGGEGRGAVGLRLRLECGVAVVVLVVCGYLTWVQAGTWRNSVTLWSHCLAVCPDNFVAHHNLGYVLQHAGKTSEAIEQYRAALRLKPDLQDANLNLGIALIDSGKAQEATNYLGTVLHYSPRYARARSALGLALLELGDYAGAVANCGEAIRLDPDEFGPYVNLGRAFSAQGKSDEALRYYAEGLRLKPEVAQTHYYLGLEWLKRGMFEQAAASFGEAVRLAPRWAEARAQQQRALNHRTAAESR
jgi:Tfp pilus assembly protein PilF